MADAIELTDVRVAYGKLVALKGLSLRVAPDNAVQPTALRAAGDRWR